MYSRSSVIAEPGAEYLDRYANELSELDELLNATEAWLTPYIWGNYTILILPPSFPFGGMENPLLTFASPTIIVGDKSQVYVATHEIAHSWTGNDVTCRDWSNLWLNEGFTVFEERKVSALKHGNDFALREAQLGNVSLWIDMENYGLNNSYSALYPVMNGANPDDSFSNVPYEKGFQFLTYLESLMATPLDFQNFIRSYILEHALTSITYIELLTSFEAYVIKIYPDEQALQIIKAVDWNTWVRQGGANPSVANAVLNFTTAGAVQFESLADEYIALGGDSSPANYSEYLNATDPQLKVIFLNRLQARTAWVTQKILAKIDTDLNVTLDPNPEIGQRWFPLTIQHYYSPTLEAAHRYVSIQGRLKYLQPVYRALVSTGRREVAYQWFVDNANFYHPIAIDSVRAIILQTKPSQATMERLSVLAQTRAVTF